MTYTAHPERLTAFEQTVRERNLIHGRCRRGAPWQNGIVERSHRTDNEECFDRVRFADPEERRYQHRLYEYHYNAQRPHQGLAGRCPMDVYQKEYPMHSASRMLN